MNFLHKAIKRNTLLHQFDTHISHFAIIAPVIRHADAHVHFVWRTDPDAELVYVLHTIYTSSRLSNIQTFDDSKPSVVSDSRKFKTHLIVFNTIRDVQ